MSFRRPAIFPALTMLALAGSSAPATARAAPPASEATTSEPRSSAEADPTTGVDVPDRPVAAASAASGHYGDASLAVVERFGRYSLPSSVERGTAGGIQGSGWDLRFMMTPGVGAYYRWSSAGQSLGHHVDWYHLEYAFGFAARLHSTGRAGTWSVRTQSRVEWGMIYFQAGTNDACVRSYAPLGTACAGDGGSGNASGAGFGSEVRLAGEVDFGPIGLSADVGAAGFRRWSTGSNSVSIPGWFWMPTAQIKLGLALAFD